MLQGISMYYMCISTHALITSTLEIVHTVPFQKQLCVKEVYIPSYICVVVIVSVYSVNVCMYLVAFFSCETQTQQLQRRRISDVILKQVLNSYEILHIHTYMEQNNKNHSDIEHITTQKVIMMIRIQYERTSTMRVVQCAYYNT